MAARKATLDKLWKTLGRLGGGGREREAEFADSHGKLCCCECVNEFHWDVGIYIASVDNFS